ncbi:hypothetical protein ONS95_003240 [Cadophora gregata]|uniref:uncharacterized protein n=1 Tax=Cadophora gregata TaxID=51156 RepID=UPI0026DB4583|nr:uncharacterized protein ONS95_003240 [Cadophora gregata]KAK0108436.1 hypothetical protein ONS95_003240 [Cadophora gregata]KAK0108971.1 hypothetical protein ONS96_002809 [Cadophora gregata f. sp. sojae]
MAISRFSSLPRAVTDEVFDLLAAFHADTHSERVNLAAGIYCNEDGLSWPLDVVRQVEKKLHDEADHTRHDYLPIAGDQQFLQASQDLIFFPSKKAGTQAPGVDDLRIASVQTISGTGANHIGARFLVDHLQPQNVWLSDPTWANHHTIWEYVGLNPRVYPYYKYLDFSLDFAGMMQTLEAHAQPQDVLVLHACAHNPTGLDPSKEQWMAIAGLCQRKQLFPFFDAAYIGFATGDPVQDTWAIRYFYEQQPRLEMIVAQSFSKSFGI